MVESSMDNGADRLAPDTLRARVRNLRRPLGVAALAALAAVPAGVQPWQAVVGYGVFAAALLIRLPGSAAARARDKDNNTAAGPEDFKLLDALDLPTIVFDEQTLVMRQNAAAVSLAGAFPANATLSARIRSPAVLELVARVIDRGEPETVEDADRVPSERWHEVRVAPVSARSAAGRRLFVLTYRDLTQSRRLDRMRSDFVANASHELRTPLASVIGFIETMQGPARNDEAARTRFFGIMLDQAQRMSRLIDDLLSLSRLEMRAHLALTAKVDLGATVAHVIDTLRPMASELGVEINFSTPDQPVILIGDADELIQVFSNLIENACKYGQSGKRVEISVTDTDANGPEVMVRDFGPGIPKEHVPRLTERFYRVDDETSRTKHGTGLGLAIVKHILNRHRARLVIRSQSGEGAVFIVKFSRPEHADTA
ncbi:ATP-binding protein [Hoeflea sp.]|uniref:ATP-binding protein n=1 Tax=Hoeflea sp. TaxID=1940281 RepID=UPI003A90D179